VVWQVFAAFALRLGRECEGGRKIEFTVLAAHRIAD
jgi:hypothetical protein